LLFRLCAFPLCTFVLEPSLVDFAIDQEIAIGIHYVVAKLAPFLRQNLVSSGLLGSGQAAVVDTPTGQLLPAVERHCGRAYHYLVELVRHGVTMGVVSSLLNNNGGRDGIT
jgi:hypothetical protein